jgi:hypothetical protein
VTAQTAEIATMRGLLKKNESSRLEAMSLINSRR